MEEPRKKRGAERQGRKEDVDSDGSEESNEPVGTWKPADESVLAGRKILKARRSGVQPESETTKHLPRPIFSFSDTIETKVTGEAKKESAPIELPKASLETEPKRAEGIAEKTNGETQEKPSIFGLFTPPADILSYKPSSFSFSTSFSFSSSSLSSLSSSNVFGKNIAPPKEPTSPPSFSFSSETGPVAKPVQLESVKTAEEDEETLFQNRSKLFVLDTTDEKPTWKERGIGVLKLNIANDRSYARILMRMDASLRLILNVRLFPALSLEKSGDRAVVFTASSLEEEGLCSYITKFRSSEMVAEFMELVEQYKNLGHTEKAEEKIVQPVETKSDKKEPADQKNEPKEGQPAEKKVEEDRQETKSEAISSSKDSNKE